MKLIAGFAAMGAFALGTASATIVSGEVTGGAAFTQGGTFIKLSVPFTESDPDNTVGNNTFQNPNVYGFDEEQNVVAGVDILTDVGSDVPAGTVVASHYIFFDPGPTTSVIARITFDAPIFGVATSTGLLAASDIYANTGVTYLNPGLRGLEAATDSVALDPMDLSTLVIRWTASNPGDYIRVFTQFSPQAEIPVPAGVWLFGSAAALFAARRARKV